MLLSAATVALRRRLRGRLENRSDMEVGMTYMIKHLSRFGLMVHVGRGTTSSKTECMFFPRPREPEDGADLSDLL